MNASTHLRPALLTLHLLVPLVATSSSADATPAGPLDRQVRLRFAEATPLNRIYAALAEATGVEFVLDEGVNGDREARIELDGVTVGRALDLLELRAGLFRAEIAEATYVVAPDNQTKRREYERQVVQTFSLEHAGVRGVNALLRGVVDVRRAAVDERTSSITISDTRDKVALAAELVGRLDQPRAEVEIGVQVLLVDRDALRTLRHDRTDGQPLLRVASTRLARLVRSDATVLASPALGVFDGEQASLAVTEPAPAALGRHGHFAFDLEVTAHVHPASESVTLDLTAALGLERADTHAETSRPATRREIAWSCRLQPGESGLLAGLLSVERGQRQGIRLVQPAPFLVGPEPGWEQLELVVALTPRIVGGAAVDPADRAALDVGTPRRVELREPNRIESGRSARRPWRRR